MKPGGRRRTVIVDKAMQMRIVLSNSLPMFAILLVAILGEFVYNQQIRAGHIASNGTIFGMPEQRLGMLLLFVFASTYQVVASLLTSQKVAGAAYRVSRTLESYRQGDHDVRAKLRKGDYQTKLADDVNEFLDWLQLQEGSGSAAPSAGTAAPSAQAGAQQLEEAGRRQ